MVACAPGRAFVPRRGFFGRRDFWATDDVQVGINTHGALGGVLIWARVVKM